MVEISNATLMEKIRKVLGLRGKVISSSRNSIYPCISYVINDNLATGVIASGVVNCGSGTQVLIAQVPANKRWKLQFFTKDSTTTNAIGLYLDNGVGSLMSGTGGNMYSRVSAGATGLVVLNTAPYIILEAGARLAAYGGAAGDTTVTFTWLYQEEDIY